MIKSRRMRLAGHVARMGEKRNACRILVGKPEGERQLGRPGRRWVDSIKIELRWDGMVWTGLIGSERGPVEGSSESGKEPSGFIKFWEVLE
jgi:hypothetical protein